MILDYNKFDYLYLTRDSEYGTAVCFSYTDFYKIINERLTIRDFFYSDYYDIHEIFDEISYYIECELKKRDVIK